MIDVSKIKAITVDLDDTLWPVLPVILRAEALTYEWIVSHAPEVSQRFDKGALRALREQLQTQDPSRKIDLLKARRDTLIEAFSHCGLGSELAIKALAVFVKARSEVDFFADALPALERLSTKWPLFALSNGFADIEAAGIGRYFVGSVSAGEIGIAKPDVRIFNVCAQRLGLQADQILHIGDDRVLDYDGANAAGMQAYWIDRPRTSLQTLVDLLLPLAFEHNI